MTLYEVGKIPAESLDAFLEAAAEVERPHELELLEYFDHAISLRIAAASSGSLPSLCSAWARRAPGGMALDGPGETQCFPVAP